MNDLLRWAARITGVIGVLLCAASLLMRASGMWVVGGLQVGTLLQGGMAAMLVGCLAYLAVLVEGTQR